MDPNARPMTAPKIATLNGWSFFSANSQSSPPPINSNSYNSYQLRRRKVSQSQTSSTDEDEDGHRARRRAQKRREEFQRRKSRKRSSSTGSIETQRSAASRGTAVTVPRTMSYRNREDRHKRFTHNPTTLSIPMQTGDVEDEERSPMRRSKMNTKRRKSARVTTRSFKDRRPIPRPSPMIPNSSAPSPLH